MENIDNIINLPCANGSEEPNEENMVLAMAYVKRQKWGEQYDDETALREGTIFPALNFPFRGKGGASNG